MRRLLDLSRRIPRPVFFAVPALIQVALIGAMVADRVGILRQGMEVTLQTRPVDPRDFLRGDYVVLGYDISTIKAGPLKDTPVSAEAATIFVKLAPKADGFYEVVSLHKEPVEISGREVLMRGHVTGGASCGNDRRVYCDQLAVRYGIEKYFVPQGEGKAIESARNQGKVSIVAAVTPAGRAAIKRLLIDGKPVYDEPLF